MGDLPQRDVLITGLTDQNQPSLKGSIEKIGNTVSIKFHKSSRVKTITSSVSFQKAGDGQKAVGRLDGALIDGAKVGVILDDKGE